MISSRRSSAAAPSLVTGDAQAMGGVNLGASTTVRGQVLDGRADGPGRRDCRVRVLACQELEGTLEVGQCPR